MKDYITTITVKGQVTVPAKIRRALGIEPSDRLHITTKNDKIIIEKNSYWSEYDKLQQRVKQHVAKKGITPITDTEIEAIRDGAWGGKSN